jgi:hypothetical protein
MPVILAAQEAEIRRTAVRSQPGQTVRKTLSRKSTSQIKSWWNGSKCSPEFEPQNRKKKKKKEKKGEYSGTFL